MMLLSELLKGYQTTENIPVVSVSGFAVDSREVKPGDVFVAIKDGVDRYQFVDQVIAKGAVAIVGENVNLECSIPHITVQDDREALLHMARTFYQHPAQELKLVGITGTDGKTTTANILFQILSSAGHSTGMISTVNAVIGDQELDTGFHVTTPEAMDVQKYLRIMVENKLSHAILETTSIGLSKKKVAPSEFDVAIVTNITHEHLDNHGSMEAYWEAKGRLFFELGTDKENSVAVLNIDDKSYTFLKERTTASIITYGIDNPADYWATNIEESEKGISFVAHHKNIEIDIHTNLVGKYNVYNCLAAIAASHFAFGISPENIQLGISSLVGVSGRMEEISMGQDFRLFVDFAHTPNALKEALNAARSITGKRVIAVFGSAGLRDKEKRRMMAETGIELADVSILTAEDPRTESLTVILQEMADGALSKGGIEGESFYREPNRADAIRKAISLANSGDAVFILGKGHEQSMCFGTTEHAWDDRTASKAALAEHLSIDGPKMPKLPHQILDSKS